MRTLAAVDLGARSGRVGVGRFDGTRLHVEEVHRFVNVPVLVGGTLHWDVLRLYGGVLDGLRAIGRDRPPVSGAAGRVPQPGRRPAVVESIGVDSWGVDFGLLDRAGRLVQNPVHYRDCRRAATTDAVYARIPSRELYDRTGIQLLPINTIFELAAMAAEADPALEAATRLADSGLQGDSVRERAERRPRRHDVRQESYRYVEALEKVSCPGSVAHVEALRRHRIRAFRRLRAAEPIVEQIWDEQHLS